MEVGDRFFENNGHVLEIVGERASGTLLVEVVMWDGKRDYYEMEPERLRKKLETGLVRPLKPLKRSV